MSTSSSYKPSAFYFRQALRSENDPSSLREIGMTLTRELEALKGWVREQGMVPPRWHCTVREAESKELGDVIPFSADGAAEG